jgi:hypothetical protein
MVFGHFTLLLIHFLRRNPHAQHRIGGKITAKAAQIQSAAIGLVTLRSF